jgi:hypothetical protein
MGYPPEQTLAFLDNIGSPVDDVNEIAACIKMGTSYSNLLKN